MVLGTSPPLCCDGKQLSEMQKNKDLLDNIIGRCPSCYYNLLHIFCEMACSPNQDQFVSAIEVKNITRPSKTENIGDDINNNDNAVAEERVHEEWASEDYVDPDEEGEKKSEKEDEEVKPDLPVEKATVVTKLRYYLLEKQAKDFIDSCW